MSLPTRRRRAVRDGRFKPVLITTAVILLMVGIYLGVELAKPPPRPDFGATSVTEQPTPPSAIEGTTPPRVTETPKPPLNPIDTPPPADADPRPIEPGRQTATVDEPLAIERQPHARAEGRAPRIAIVIDDLGRSLRDLDTLADLGVPLTYSVLPFETRTQEVVAELTRRQSEILCHLPMEAKGGNNPGPGALLLSMNHDELIAATRDALSAVPGAVGVNNHMGSGLLSRREAITAVLSVVGEHKLYFLDSRTSADTLGYSLARHLGLRAAERQVFLDTHRDRSFIESQFAALQTVAQRRGAAIAIAHPYNETLEVLAKVVPAARAAGFEFVTASTLVDN